MIYSIYDTVDVKRKIGRCTYAILSGESDSRIRSITGATSGIRAIYNYICLVVLVVFIMIVNGACASNSELILDSGNSIIDNSDGESSDTEYDNSIETVDYSDSHSNIQSECIVDMEEVSVHIVGAICTPGLYTLPSGSRIDDVIKMAGGYSEDADIEYVNIAARIMDGSKIRIPTKEEVVLLREDNLDNSSEYGIIEDSTSNGLISEDRSEDPNNNLHILVNINMANEKELMTLPGIGESKARAIIEYRSIHGDYVKIEDIMKVTGIKQAGFDKIKDRITIK